MRYLALATDYDGTLADHGHVDDETLAALTRLKASGRRLVLVTGRRLDDLNSVFPHLELFDRVVAENGALLYEPGTHKERLLTVPVDDELVQALREQNVQPLSIGKAIAATCEPNVVIVLKTIRDLGRELQIEFNKGNVMVLPSGVTKASGLAIALDDLGLSRHNLAGVGDAENDHAFLQHCECAVAVANALPALKERVDLTMTGARGAGVRQLVDELLRDDLASAEPRLTRHHISLGFSEGRPVLVSPYGNNILLAGPSGSGKSMLAKALLEGLTGRGYQVAVVDPEADFEDLEGIVSIGSAQRAPSAVEVISILEKPAVSVVVTLLGLPLHDRPGFFSVLFPQLNRLRLETGHPHFLVVDEAHHLLPQEWERAVVLLPKELLGLVFVTVHPGMVSRVALQAVDILIAVGEAVPETLADFAGAVGEEAPPEDEEYVCKAADEAVLWRRGEKPFRFRMAQPEAETSRHRRKYVLGDVGEEASFYFRGPGNRLHLRAQNLTLFLQLADGVDDDTWMHHLRAGDYSSWIARSIKDRELSEEIAVIEAREDLAPAESRRQVRQAVERRYTAAA